MYKTCLKERGGRGYDGINGVIIYLEESILKSGNKRQQDYTALASFHPTLVHEKKQYSY